MWELQQESERWALRAARLICKGREGGASAPHHLPQPWQTYRVGGSGVGAFMSIRNQPWGFTPRAKTVLPIQPLFCKSKYGSDPT